LPHKPTILILGCGYTGRRVARLMSTRGRPVIQTSRDPGDRAVALDLLEPGSIERFARAVSGRVRALYSIPAVGQAEPLLAALAGKVERMVYLSTTGVYGAIREVDETTPVSPRTEREKLRVATEKSITSGSWSTLVLRAAAIYGPSRGVHASMRAGRFRLIEDGQNMISRIHVDDLAAIAAAGLDSELTGAFPVADDEPCSSAEVAVFCSRLLDLPSPPSIPRDQASETRQADRRVDGRAIRRLLGVELRYPSFRIGIPAALAAEQEVSDATLGLT
jgi:nucleoside-diphosphate-sugar epimerase